MSVFCHGIKGMLRTEVTDNRYMCGWISVLQFSWNGAVLLTDVMYRSYIVIFCTLKLRHAQHLLHVAVTCRCYIMVLRYMSVPTFAGSFVQFFPFSLSYSFARLSARLRLD